MTISTAEPSLAQTIGEDIAVFVGPFVLVSSRSHLGDFHSVLDGRCSCLGFSYYGRCRHLPIAAQAMENDRATAEPVEPELYWAGSSRGCVPVRSAR